MPTLTDAVNTLVSNTTTLQTTVSGRITDMDGKISAANTAKLAAETAKAGAEVAKGLADTAKTDAETAQTLANNAKIAAESAQGVAATAKTDALTAKAATETAKGNAIAAQAASESAKNSAQDWATKTTGAVDGGEYSAKYHAAAASASASTAAATLANKADTTYVDSQIGAININDISGNLAVTGGIKLGNDTRTAPTAGAGALRWNATTNKLQNSTGTEWLDVKYEAPGSIGNPVTSTNDLSGEASGVYYINSPSGTFQGYVENTIHGGGWLGAWNLSAHGSSTDKRSYDESAFWSGSTVEGANEDFYTQFHKGASVYKYGNFTEILIVAHDNGGSPPATYGGTGGAFGNTYTIKTISSAAVGHTLDWMMSQGNDYVVSTATTSRGGTVGGDGYHRTSGDVFIDEDYNIVFNSTYNGGSGATNNVRFGTNQTNSGDIELNGHNTGGGYGGKHYRSGNYGLAYTAQPQQGYHNSGTYISYGQAWQNLSDSAHTVWGSDASQPSNVLMVDFAIYVR